MLEAKNPTDGGGRGGAGVFVQRGSGTDLKNSSAAAKVKPLTSTERSRLKRKRDAASAAASPAATRAAVAPMQRVALRAVLILVALLLAGVGMSMTVTYNATTAAGADRIVLGTLAACADALALILPAAAAALWRARRRLLALMAVGLWLAAAATTASNISGFIGVHGDSFLSGRETASVERGLVLERIARLRAERAAITESRPVGEIVLAIRNASKGQIDAERVALVTARRRDEIDVQLAAVEQTVRTLPAVTTADPSASTLAGIIHVVSGVAIAADALQRARLALLLLLPLLAGLALALGSALGRRGTP